jgi:hypothetical protein
MIGWQLQKKKRSDASSNASFYGQLPVGPSGCEHWQVQLAPAALRTASQSTP